MITEILSLGNKIELKEIPSSINRQISNHRMYVSQIMEFEDEEENRLNIAMPIYEGRIIPLEIGARYEMCFYTPKGLYAANGEVVNRYKMGNIYIVVVDIISKLVKHQRRQYFRLECTMNVLYKILNRDELRSYRINKKLPIEFSERPFLKGITVDISGGGVRFVSVDKVQNEDLIFVSLNFDGGSSTKTIETMARVVTSLSVKNKNNLCENRIEFVDIKPEDREFIIKYVFEEERRLRKKLLG